MRIPNWLSRGFLGSVLTLLSGNIIAQFIRVGCIPIITRIFSPSSYGEFSLALSIIAVATTMSHLRYNVAIMLPEKEADSHALTLLSLLIVAIFSLVGLVIVVAFNEFIVDLIGFSTPKLAYLLPLAIFFSGSILTLQMRYLRNKNFRKLSVAQIAGAFISRAYVVPSGVFFGVTSIYLLLMRIIQDLVVCLVLLVTNLKVFLREVFSVSTLRRIPAMAKAYSEFPKYCYTDFILQATRELPVFLITTFFGAKIVGFYALTIRALNEPSLVIGSAISRSFFQHVAERLNRNEDVSEFILNLILVKEILLLLPGLIFIIYAPHAFALVFGAEWEQAGVYLRLLCPFYFVTFISLSTNTLFDILKKQRVRFGYSILLMISSAISLLCGGLTGNVLFTIAFFSLSNSVVLFSRIVWITNHVGVENRELYIALIKPWGVALPLFILQYAVFIYGATFIVQATICIFVFSVYIIFYYPMFRRFIEKRNAIKSHDSTL